MDKSEKNLS
jgi:hypothetical protein